MLLPLAGLDDTVVSPSKELLAAVEAFLDQHYEFRRQGQYKGFRGKIRAYCDRNEAERREYIETGAVDCDYRSYTYKANIVQRSDPLSEEDLKKIFPREPLENSFSAALMELIEVKGKNSVEVYKRAHIDRKLFSKIRKRSCYIPSKRTIIALALALELSFDETCGLLKRAGFAFSRSILFDVIIEYFILQGQYDIFEINNVLVAHDQPPLGCE